MKRLMCFLGCTVCLVLTTNAMAAFNDAWNNTDGDEDWMNANNWSAGVPTDTAIALINHPTLSSPGGDVTISSGAAVAQRLYLWDGTFTLAAGASLSTADEARYEILGYADGTATANVAGDWTMSDTRGMFVGFGVGSNATLNVTGDGSLTAYRLQVGNRPGATGKVNLLGGTITVTVGSNFILDADGGSPGTMQIENDGLLVLGGDVTTLANGYITSGYLYTTDSGLSVSYDGVEDLTYVTVIPEPATIGLLCIGGLLLRKRK